MRAAVRASHLARRWAASLSRREPDPADVDLVRGLLSGSEFALWRTMRVEDRRHSIDVLRRFDRRAGAAPTEVRAGVVLHDVGKLESDLGVLGRVVATLIGPRGARFAAYHDHERLGAVMLERAGSAPATIDVVMGRGAFSAALRDADDL